MANVECTHCGKPHDTIIDLSTVPRVLSTKEQQQEQGQQSKESTFQKPKADPYVPEYVPKFKCKGCGGLHPNKKFKGLPVGRCDTCGEKFATKKGGKCPYCRAGEIEELSDSDIEELDLYLPEIEELEDQDGGHNHGSNEEGEWS